MRDTTQVRGLDLVLLSQVRKRNPGRTQGSLINEALRRLLEDAPPAPAPALSGLVIRPAADPKIDLGSLPIASLPGVCLSDEVSGNRQ